MTWLDGVSETGAPQHKYNLIISFTCIYLCDTASKWGACGFTVVPCDAGDVWITTCALCTQHPIIIAIYENYAVRYWLVACRFDYFYYAATRVTCRQITLLHEHRNADELQLNQIIRHHDEWIISPGYLSHSVIIMADRMNADLPDALHCIWS